jgi:hypothetical protein
MEKDLAVGRHLQQLPRLLQDQDLLSNLKSNPSLQVMVARLEITLLTPFVDSSRF